MSRSAQAIGLLVLLAITGCAPHAKGVGPEMLERVDRLDLWAGAMASDLDGRPGADGISLRLTLFQATGGKIIVGAPAGNVEILLYDGSVDYRSLGETEPFASWLFTPGQMRAFLGRFYGLWCYEMTLPWADKAPTLPSVTVVARYQRPDGSFLYSAPATIPIR